MPYVGGSLTVLFGKEAQGDTRVALRRMAERGADRWQAVTTENTPIGGRALEGDGGGNLRSSWYTLPVQRVRHPLGPGYRSGVASDVDYAPDVEYGTGLWGPQHRKYLIRPKRPGGMLRWRDPHTGRYVYARSVMHPGSPGQHMLEIGGRAMEAEADASLFDGITGEWSRVIERRADRQR